MSTEERFEPNDLDFGGAAPTQPKTKAKASPKQEPPSENSSPPPALPKSSGLDISLALVEVPTTMLVGGFVNDYLNVKLSARQAKALKRVTTAADQAQCVLRDGSRVIRPAQGIRFLLELLADAIEEMDQGKSSD